MRSKLMKLIKSGRFPNDKNRIWTMCQVVIKLALMTVEEAEKSNLTNEQFYLAFEDILNKVSIKDHNKQDTEIVDDFKKFNTDSK